jgi:hypothetical protein
MDEHERYFHDHLAADKVLLFGRVMASGVAFGRGVLEVENKVEAVWPRQPIG